MSERIDENESTGSMELPNDSAAIPMADVPERKHDEAHTSPLDVGDGASDTDIVVPKKQFPRRAVSIADGDTGSIADAGAQHDGKQPVTHGVSMTQRSANERRAGSRQPGGTGSDSGQLGTHIARRQRAGQAAKRDVVPGEEDAMPIRQQAVVADGVKGDANTGSPVRASSRHDAAMPDGEMDAANDVTRVQKQAGTGNGNDVQTHGHALHHHVMPKRSDGVHDDTRDAGVADAAGKDAVTNGHAVDASKPTHGNGASHAGSVTQPPHASNVPPFMSALSGGSTAHAVGKMADARNANAGAANGTRGGVPEGMDVADGMSARDARRDGEDGTTVISGDDEPTRMMNRPASMPKLHEVAMIEPDRTHDDVATAYGMSGAIPPIPPIAPTAGARGGNGNGGRRRRGSSRKRRRVVIAIVVVVLVALGIAYGVGVSRYQSRLFPNTEIGGVNVSEMTADEAERATDTSDWHITIDDVTGDTVTIGKDDAGMSVSGTSPSDMIASQDAFAWPLHVFGGSGQSADRTVSFDYDKLEQTLSSLEMCDESKRTAATDASFRYDQSAGKWYVTPDAQGTVVDKDKLISAVEDALDGLNSPTVKVTQDMCIQPSVTASDESLNSAVNDANKWISTSITYDIDDQQSAVTVDSATILPWVSITKGDDGKFSATLDESAVKAYLAKIGDKYDTTGEQLTITTPTGKVASVAGTEDDTGWLTDEATELTKLVDDIKNGRTDHREFSMKHKANATTGSDVWGTTYIEVDLSTQHLWYIKDGQVAEDFGIISGKSGYDTPQGVTAVYKKVTNVTLVSPWTDPETGEPTYKTPIDVGLVISKDGNILIHSAPWQPSNMFGNASYHVSGGSHGCVNAPTDKTWDLYNTVPLNTPVVVHS